VPLNDRNSNMLEWALLGVTFALLMQVRPFRWAFYALLAWGGFLMVQDWWSEHVLPDDTPAFAWGIEGAEPNVWSGKDSPTYDVSLWFQNRGYEEIQDVQLIGTLYECAAPDTLLDGCTPVDREVTALTLDLAPGFRQHRKETVSFHNAGGSNPRVGWRIGHIVADSDAAVE
jgi:hypothetical protein